MDKTIHDLDLGEYLNKGALTFFRVPGGWVVALDDGNSSSFVPYSPEFRPPIEMN